MFKRIKTNIDNNLLKTLAAKLNRCLNNLNKNQVDHNKDLIEIADLVQKVIYEFEKIEKELDNVYYKHKIKE